MTSQSKINSEVWKDVNGYSGIYQISDNGRVKSIGRIKKFSKYNPNVTLHEKIMVTHLDSGGYPYISLLKDGVRKRHRIHKLVASHFIDNYQSGIDVNHIDGVKTNNNISNLENISRSGNIKHAYSMGLRKRGIKLSQNDVYAIKHKIHGVPQRLIADAFNIFQTTVSDIRRNRIWKEV